MNDNVPVVAAVAAAVASRGFVDTRSMKGTNISPWNTHALTC